MLTSALLEARTGVAPAAPTLSEREREVPPKTAFASLGSLFDELSIANDNPRSLDDELAARLVSTQRELSLVSMYLSPAFRTGTMRQLANLLDPDSWDEDDDLLDLQSVRSFARAMAVLRPTKRPMLGLSSKGNLLAMWGSDVSRLSFEHLANDEIKWFIHSRAEGDHDLAAGTTHIGRVRQILDAHGTGSLLYGEG